MSLASGQKNTISNNNAGGWKADAVVERRYPVYMEGLDNIECYFIKMEVFEHFEQVKLFYDNIIKYNLCGGLILYCSDR